MQNPGESRGHAVPDLHELPETKPPFLCFLLLHVLDVEKLGLRPMELCLETFRVFRLLSFNNRTANLPCLQPNRTVFSQFTAFKFNAT